MLGQCQKQANPMCQIGATDPPKQSVGTKFKVICSVLKIAIFLEAKEYKIVLGDVAELIFCKISRNVLDSCRVNCSN